MPQIHATKHYYRVRIRKPSKRKYVRYRVIQIDGVKAVVGVKRKKGKRGGKTETQSILVPKRYGLKAARKWRKRFKKK
jgi:hypothetical protein